MLDLFTYTGSFAIAAALGGAASVTAVDTSAAALAVASQNLVLNGLEGQVELVEDDMA